jgi:dolichyl-phosphate beta-glucosyltransferase
MSYRVLCHAPRRGKGYAVRRGVMESAAELVLLCDADLSVPLGEFAKLRSAIDAGAEVAIGSRDVPGAWLDPPQPWARRLGAALFKAVRRRLLLRGIADTQCGFKLFRGGVARELFAAARIDGWMFDCEILALAAARGLVVREMGVTWRDRADSRVRPLRDAPGVLRDLLWIWRRCRRSAAR